MPTISVDTLDFIFPDNWKVLKYDDQSFHKKHFHNLAASKCVDIIAFSAADEFLWLIEGTDYRLYQGEKPTGEKRVDVLKEFAEKVRDTLANLHLAERRPESEIYDFVKLASKKVKFRVVLHLEQSAKPSKLHPQVVKWHDAHIKLRHAVRVVDPHPWLCKMSDMPLDCPWRVIAKP